MRLLLIIYSILFSTVGAQEQTIETLSSSTQEKHQVFFVVRLLMSPPGEQRVEAEDLLIAANAAWDQLCSMDLYSKAAEDVDFSAFQLRQSTAFAATFDSSDRDACLLVAEGYIQELLSDQNLAKVLRLVDGPFLVSTKSISERAKIEGVWPVVPAGGGLH